MRESIAEYKRRILSYQAGKDPIQVQTATAGKIWKLRQGQPRSRMVRRPGPGRWSVVEILAHLADCELVAGYRIRSILGAPGTSLAAFDQDKWAESGNYSTRDPKQSLELFSVLRKGNLALVRSLKAAQWKLHGVHAERGPETIGEIVQLYAGHDLNHLNQIMLILGKRAR